MSLVDKDDQQPSAPSVNDSFPAPSEMATNSPNSPNDPYLALRSRDFRLLIIGTFLSSIGGRMLEVALGWELYERTHSALVLGGVGLVLIIPVILFSLPAGHIIDRFNRKYIMLFSQCFLVLGSLGLTLLSLHSGSIALIYACLLVIGSATAFGSPASSALTALTVPREAFENSATWNSSSWQLASVLGPGLGGLMIAFFKTETVVYALNTLLAVIFFILVFSVKTSGRARPAIDVAPSTEETSSRHDLFEGLRFLSKTQVLFAAITLDLFAVLLGGATTLLPVFASDILHVGPTGLGWLRAAPSVGAILVALIVAHQPPFKRAGRTLLLAVVGFGLATIVFGLSKNFWLSLLMLFLLGGLDNISVVIRGALVLTRTPEHMRGRVSAVNALFVGTSNELGGFESGLTSQLFGPVFSVVGGGIGTILVVICIALFWPEMRRLGTLRDAEMEALE